MEVTLMAKITIKYFGMISLKLNLHEEEENVEESTNIGELIETLRKKHGDLIEKYIKQGYQVLLERGGKTANIVHFDNYGTQLIEGDKILFVYAFAGG
jgi:molybdopterin converting factor small subunit